MYFGRSVNFYLFVYVINIISIAIKEKSCIFYVFWLVIIIGVTHHPGLLILGTYMPISLSRCPNLNNDYMVTVVITNLEFLSFSVNGKLLQWFIKQIRGLFIL